MDSLPRRDLWLLPLISVATLAALLAGSEVLARLAWPEQISNSCDVADDSILGFRDRPNCTSTMKAVEGPWYTNEYNACGYRTKEPCGPLPPGARRIALVGASLSEGYLVEYPDTIGARLAADLTAMCGKPVEVQNLAAKGYTGRRVAARLDEALAMRPDAVLFTQNPFDIEAQLDDATLPFTGDAPAADPARGKGGVDPGMMKRVGDWLTKYSRTSTVLRHFLFRNQSLYLSLYLKYGDKADFLRPPMSTAWQERLRRSDLLLGELASRAHKAGVPLMLAFRAESSELALMTEWTPPAGIDPNALPQALAAIAARHGVDFVDTSAALRPHIGGSELLFYPVDGHPTGEGQPIIAQAIAQRFVDDPKSPFFDCNSTASNGKQAAKP